MDPEKNWVGGKKKEEIEMKNDSRGTTAVDGGLSRGVFAVYARLQKPRGRGGVGGGAQGVSLTPRCRGHSNGNRRLSCASCTVGVQRLGCWRLVNAICAARVCHTVRDTWTAVVFCWVFFISLLMYCVLL